MHCPPRTTGPCLQKLDCIPKKGATKASCHILKSEVQEGKAQDMFIFFSRQNVEATLALTSMPRVSPALEETFSESLPSIFPEFRPFPYWICLFAGLDPEERLTLSTLLALPCPILSHVDLGLL